VQPTAGKAKFTPGPLQSDSIMKGGGADYAILDSDGCVIGEAFQFLGKRNGTRDAQANAQLWAAAPEIYEALEDGRERLIKIAAILNGGELTPAKRREAYTLAYDGKQTAALAKARGETP